MPDGDDGGLQVDRNGQVRKTIKGHDRIKDEKYKKNKELKFKEPNVETEIGTLIRVGTTRAA